MNPIMTPMMSSITAFFAIEENLKQLQCDSNVVFNDKIDSIISYKKWFFGHFHEDEVIEDVFVAMYNEIVVI